MVLFHAIMLMAIIPVQSALCGLQPKPYKIGFMKMCIEREAILTTRCPKKNWTLLLLLQVVTSSFFGDTL